MMARNVVSIDPNQSIQEAAALMEQHHIGSLPVVQNGELMGIITDRDITLRSTAKGKDGHTHCSECMSREPVSGSPEMDAHEAALVMGDSQIRRLPIVENGELVGVVALGDFALNDIYANEAEQALAKISVRPI
ncbi:CBS domain-containing protein [Salicibibacter kimchii]|uniref:CBS domain-containing protein n=1 Tax=Salicibibacter kimchii TaxID=2099786 RepID=A0A345C3K4_9BACI|nr:CBS domain-containing protein [Salicibibacter kimchii]AXF57785.1 CBS domain-containing protein [Salicibibacter kimchii]